MTKMELGDKVGIGLIFLLCIICMFYIFSHSPYTDYKETCSSQWSGSLVEDLRIINNITYVQCCMRQEIIVDHSYFDWYEECKVFEVSK